MGLFGSKKNAYLGVDLGVGGLKVVELRNEKGRAHLVTYGFTERMPDVQPISPVDQPQETADLLKAILKKSKTTTTRAVFSLPVASVFSSVITIPKSAKKTDQDEAIRWQAKKLIPVPLEEMMLDYKVISLPDVKGKDSKEDGNSVPVLITGASRAMVQKYIAVARLVGLELVSIDTEAFGMIRSLVGKDRSTAMLVDIGAVRTNIVIVENGIPYVTRSLDMGGASFSKAIASSLSISLDAAEKMKCDIKGIQGIYPNEGLPKIFENTMSPLVTELQYSLNLYAGRDRNSGAAEKRVEKVILTGGGAALPALADYFARQLNMKVYAGDPWARVIYPDGLRPILDDIGYRFAVSVGLGMRDIE